MNALQLLTATKERLLTKGWTQGRLGSENGPNCLMGAMYFADPNPLFADDYTFIAVRVLRSVIGGEVSLAFWNDSSERVFEDVIDVLDLAIESLEE